MKKFGRGYVLDFNALMKEVRQTPETDRTTSVAGPDGSSNGSTTKKDFNRSISYNFGDIGTEDGALPSTKASPTGDTSPEFSQNMNRMPSRMSVSRTGRCKNKDRQRLTVLQTEDFFYRVSTAEANKLSSTEATVAPPTGKTGIDSSNVNEEQEFIRENRPKMTTMANDGLDFDSALSAVENSTQPQTVITNCYSF